MPAGALRRDIAALLLLCFLFPVLMCLLFLPTPTDDLREQINVGVNFPLYTWKNPPLQSWIAGLVAQLPVRDAWPYVVAAQILHFIALLYLVLIAREFISRDAVLPVAIAFLGSIFTWFSVPSTALNADQIQTPLWLGLLYHALAAARDNRWRDWIACGLFAGLAVLAKYFSAIFIAALGLALLASPPDRVVLRTPGLYAAAAIAAAMVAPHAVAALAGADHSYGMDTVQPESGLTRRLGWLGALIWPFVIYGGPPLIALAVVIVRWPLQAAGPTNDAARLIVTLFAVLVGALVLLILLGGFRYRARYSEPLMPLAILALFCMFRMPTKAVPRFVRAMLAVVAFTASAGVALAQLYVVGKQRDPGDRAATIIRAEWDKKFPCGPAYILGAQNDAYAVGLYFGRGAIGVSPGDFAYGQWIDRNRLRELGAVIIENPRSADHSAFAAAFPGGEPLTRLELPYRHWWRDGPRHLYLYRFVAPEKCALGER